MKITPDYSIPEGWRIDLPPVVAVLGSAPGGEQEVSDLIAETPSAVFVLPVNDAIRIWPAQHAFTLHGEKAEAFREIHRKKWGFPVTIHSRHNHENRGVDVAWPGTSTNATSAWGAVRWAKINGAQSIVLCGCPFEAIGYAVETVPPKDGCDPVGHNDDMCRRYAMRLQEKVASGEARGVSSMSGRSADILGRPAWL